MILYFLSNFSICALEKIFNYPFKNMVYMSILLLLQHPLFAFSYINNFKKENIQFPISFTEWIANPDFRNLGFRWNFF
jgi:hypothetical protein